MKPFRFGAVCENALDPNEWAETARRIEDAGFSTLLMPDHLDDRFAPLPALVAAANATSSLRLGTLVLDNDFRHPVMLAKEASTVDMLSGGRFELGLGAGWERKDYDWSGIPFDPPGKRVARLRESVEVLKGLFCEEPFSYKGRHYQITGLDSRPKPAQRPHPPLLIGAGGPRMLTLAAQQADIVNVNFRLDAGVFGGATAATGTRHETAAKIALLRNAAGARFDNLELSVTVFVAVITEDRTTVAHAVAGGMGIPPEEVLQSPHVLIGSLGQLEDELHRRREEYGFSYFAFALNTYKVLTPLVSRLAGT